MLLDLLGLLQPSALQAEEPPPRAPRPRSFAEDALPLAALIVAGVTGITWSDDPVRAPQPRRAQLEEFNFAPLGRSFFDEESPRRIPAARARAEDALPLGARATPFLWQETPVSAAHRRVASTDDAPPFDPLQVTLKSFQDGEPTQHVPRSRATVEDALPLTTRIAFLWQETPVAQARRRGPQIEDGPPLDPLQVTLRSFQDGDLPQHAPRSRAAAEDALPLAAQIAFLWQETPRSASRRVRPQFDDALPFDPLQITLKPFLDIDPAPPGKRFQKTAEESFVPIRVLAPTLNDDPARPRAPLRARAEDTQPWNRVLLPFLHDDLPQKKAPRPQSAEDARPLTLLEESDLASFLEGEHPAPIRRVPQSGGDSYLPLRVLASFLDLEPPPLGKRYRARAEDAFIPLKVLAPFLEDVLVRASNRSVRLEEPSALSPLDQNDVASYLDDERPSTAPRRYARASDTFPENPVLRSFLEENLIRVRTARAHAEDTDVLAALDQNDVVSFLDDEQTSSSPRHPPRATDTFPETRVLFPILSEERFSRSVWRSVANDTFPEKPLLKPFLDETVIRARAPHAHAEETDALPPLDQNDVASFLDEERLSGQARRQPRATDTFPEKPVLAPFLDENGRIVGRRHTAPLEETELPPLDQNEVASFLDDEVVRRPARGFLAATDALPPTRVLEPFLEPETPPARVPPPRRTEEPFWLAPILKPFLDESLRVRITAAQTLPVETDLPPLDQNDVASFLDEEVPPRSRALHAQSQEAWPEKPVLAPFFLADEITPPKRRPIPIILIDSNTPETLPEPFQLSTSFMNQDVPRPSTFVRPRTAETTFQDAPFRPPTPPKPRLKLEPTRRSSGGGGGNALFLPGIPYNPPPWLERFSAAAYDEREEDEPSADFALMHVPSSTAYTAVKALANGVVSTIIDSKGRPAIMLTGDDGTRYLYADVTSQTVVTGTRVKAGQIIARTKTGGLSLPDTSSNIALQASTEKTSTPPPRPTQFVFVQPPSRKIELPPLAPAAAPRMIFKLVPITPPPIVPFLGETVRAPEEEPSSIARAIVPAAVLVVALYVISSLLSSREDEE